MDVNKGCCISASTLSTYRVKLGQVRVLMIDEISFVGARLFNCIDERLCLTMDVDDFFGGITHLYWRSATAGACARQLHFRNSEESVHRE